MKVYSDDVIIRIVNMPVSIRGYVTDSPDGVHNVYVNANLTREMQEMCTLHELAHISNNDLASYAPVSELEA